MFARDEKLEQEESKTFEIKEPWKIDLLSFARLFADKQNWYDKQTKIFQEINRGYFEVASPKSYTKRVRIGESLPLTLERSDIVSTHAMKWMEAQHNVIARAQSIIGDPDPRTRYMQTAVSFLTNLMDLLGILHRGLSRRSSSEQREYLDKVRDEAQREYQAASDRFDKSGDEQDEIARVLAALKHQWAKDAMMYVAEED